LVLKTYHTNNFKGPTLKSLKSSQLTMTTDQEKDKAETATSGQPHLAKQSLVGLDVGKLTPLSPEVVFGCVELSVI
jgi:hypothetical protein